MGLVRKRCRTRERKAMVSIITRKFLLPLKTVTTTILLATLFAGNTYALPQGGQITVGSGTITQSDTIIAVNQITDKLAINWESFGIAESETVRFIQPSRHAVALNRIVGSDPSVIYGQLSANGNVFLINPNGILFSKGSKVDIGGLVASTLNLSDTDFIKGNYTFSDSVSPGKVVNGGYINVADSGYIVLVGNQVENTGEIKADKGNAVLAAGGQIVLDAPGDGKLNIVVDRSIVDAAVMNSGVIKTDAGQTLLTGRSQNDVLAAVVNNIGIIEAKTISNQNGVIILDGGSSGTQSSGRLDATGEMGGLVKVLGKKVVLLDGSNIDVSGNKGGTLNIGGNSSTITIENGSLLNSGSGVITLEADTMNFNGGLITGSGSLVIQPTAKSGQRIALGTDDNGGLQLSSAAVNSVIGGDFEDITIGRLEFGNQIFVNDFTAPGNMILRSDADGGKVTIIGCLDMADKNLSILSDESVDGLAGKVTNVAILSGKSDNGDFILNDSANSIQQLGSSIQGITAADAISITNSSTQAFTIAGMVDGNTDGCDNNPITIRNLNENSDLVIESGGHVRTSGPADIYLTVEGGSSAKFINNADANALSPGSERWLIYSYTPSSNKKGGLIGDFKHYNWNFTDNGPVSSEMIERTGRGFIYSYAPILTPIGASRIYGDSNQTVKFIYDGLLDDDNIEAAQINGTYTITIPGDEINEYSSAGTKYDNGKDYLLSFTNYDIVSDLGYVIGNANSVPLEIMKRIITVTAQDASKLYDKGVDPVFKYKGAGWTDWDDQLYSGALIRSESGNQNVGQYDILLGDLALGNANYDLTYSGGAKYTINTRPLTASSITAQDRSYDRTTYAVLNGGKLEGVLSGDVVNLVINDATANFNDKNVGNNKDVAVYGLKLDGAASANYVLSNADTYTTSANISAKSISIAKNTIKADSKVYDKTLNAVIHTEGGVLSDGVITGDEVLLNLDLAIGRFADKYARNGKTVNVSGAVLMGKDAGNYHLNSYATLADVVKRNISVELIGAVTKTYDGNTTATLTLQDNYNLIGILPGDRASLANFGTGIYESKNVGSEQHVSVKGLYLLGDDSVNYNITTKSIGGFIGTITPKNIAVIGITADNKVYDGSEKALLKGVGQAGLDGVILNDKISLVTSEVEAYFDNKNVGSGKYVAVSGLRLTGDDAKNYNLSGVSTTADITTRPITISVTDGQGKVYGDNDPILSYDVANIVEGDTLDGALERIAGENSGVYQISQGTLANPQYNIVSFKPSKFIISPATLTYIASLAYRPIGTANPNFTGTVLGFKRSDTFASALTGNLTFTSFTDLFTPVGYYPIIGSGLHANNGNYIYAQDSSNLTALKVTGLSSMAQDSVTDGVNSFLGHNWSSETYKLNYSNQTNLPGIDILSGNNGHVEVTNDNGGSFIYDFIHSTDGGITLSLVGNSGKETLDDIVRRKEKYSIPVYSSLGSLLTLDRVYNLSFSSNKMMLTPISNKGRAMSDDTSAVSSLASFKIKQADGKSAHYLLSLVKDILIIQPADKITRTAMKHSSRSANLEVLAVGIATACRDIPILPDKLKAVFIKKE